MRAVAPRSSQVGHWATLGRALAAALRNPSSLAVRNPVLLLFLVRVVQEISKFLARRWRWSIGRGRVRGTADEIDPELIQGCLLSTENLLGLGRVEKRTVFTRPLLEVFGGNEYLVQELLRAAQMCRRRSNNCLVSRWLPPDERYHVLQASLNITSSLFGSNYVHFNAVNASQGEGGQGNALFKSTWYCLTVATPTRPEGRFARNRRSVETRLRNPLQTCTFTDMSREPRATLRVMLVNETEIRRIADGKLSPPSWGFFNTRHAERYRMLVDFSRNFQKQLVRTPPDCSGSAMSRSPFTSEKAHVPPASPPPDGGMMKRVHSQPNLNPMQKKSTLEVPSLGADNFGCGMLCPTSPSKPSIVALSDDTEDGAAEDCCFLRLHVPHFVGPSTPAAAPNVVVVTSPGANGDSLQAATVAGLKKVRSEMVLSPSNRDQHEKTSHRVGDHLHGGDLGFAAGMPRLCS